jgi:hypothetical protein
MSHRKRSADWVRRAEDVKRINADRNLPLWEKARHVGGVYAGLDLTDLPAKHRRKILAKVASVNAILAKYPIETFDDYRMIEPQDLRAMIAAFQSLGALKV